MTQTDWENLARLLKLIGGKFIIVEDGKPSAVLLDYQEFQDLTIPRYSAKLADKIEEINSEITEAQLRDLREEVITDFPQESAEIRIEPIDLES